MATVVIPTIFQGPTRGVSRIEVSGATIGDCFDEVEAQFPGVKELVVDPEAAVIHKFVKVTLNGELLAYDVGTLDTPISDSDEIEVVAAIAGG